MAFRALYLLSTTNERRRRRMRRKLIIWGPAAGLGRVWLGGGVYESWFVPDYTNA